MRPRWARSKLRLQSSKASTSSPGVKQGSPAREMWPSASQQRVSMPESGASGTRNSSWAALPFKYAAKESSLGVGDGL